jgi:hypothetical protein
VGLEGCSLGPLRASDSPMVASVRRALPAEIPAMIRDWAELGYTVIARLSGTDAAPALKSVIPLCDWGRKEKL